MHVSFHLHLAAVAHPSPVTCTLGSQRKHNIWFIENLKGKVFTDFDNITKRVNNKITEICRLDKEAWKHLDDEEEGCKKKLELVDRAVNEKVNSLKNIPYLPAEGIERILTEDFR